MVNSAMVASSALDKGITMAKRIRTWPAPSMVADSLKEAGISLKKFTNMITFHAEMAPGRIIAQRVSIICKFRMVR